MNSGILVPVLTALAGAGVAGIVAEWRQVQQNKREALRPIRRVLHRQLNIWHTFQTGDRELLLDALAASFGRRYKVDAKEIRRELVASPLGGVMLDKLLKEILPGDLATRYEEAVVELSEVDPFLAFRLGGKAGLHQYTDTLDRLAVAEGANVSDPHYVAASRIMRAEIHKHAAKLLREDIEEVAGLLGWRARRRARRLLRRVDLTKHPELDEALDSVMSQLESLFGLGGPDT